jgi:hypothetical protein
LPLAVEVQLCGLLAEHAHFIGAVPSYVLDMFDSAIGLFCGRVKRQRDFWAQAKDANSLDLTPTSILTRQGGIPLSLPVAEPI